MRSEIKRFETQRFNEWVTIHNQWNRMNTVGRIQHSQFFMNIDEYSSIAVLYDT